MHFDWFHLIQKHFQIQQVLALLLIVHQFMEEEIYLLQFQISVYKYAFGKKPHEHDIITIASI